MPDRKLHVVHALAPLNDEQLKATGADELFVATYHRIAAGSAEKMLAQLIEDNLRTADERVGIHLRPTSPDALVREQAQATDSALVALGKHGQHMGKALLASNLPNVLHHAECDVLVVRWFGCSLRWVSC